MSRGNVLTFEGPKPLPATDVRAETGVLCAVMLDNAALATAIALLKPADFYRVTHQHIFEAMCALYEKGQPVDVVTLAAEMRGRGTWDAASATVLGLDRALPTAAHVEHHARIVRKAALKRELRKTAQAIMALADDERVDGSEAIDQADAAFAEVLARAAAEDPADPKAAAIQLLRDLEARAKLGGEMAGVPTGFIDLDHITDGLRPGQLVLLAARPSVGKTALAMNIARNVALTSGPVLFASLEMNRNQILSRLLTLESGIPYESVTKARFTEHQWTDVAGALDRIARLPLHIVAPERMTPAELRALAHRHQAKERLALIVVDYLDQLDPSVRNKADTQEQITGRIGKALKSLAKEMGVPVLSLVQLNRGVEKRDDKRPRMSDMKNSGTLEAEADVVALMYRDDYYSRTRGEASETEVIIDKNREGRTGLVKLWFRGSAMRFDNYA